MSSSATDLRVAELLAQEKSSRDIEKALHVSSHRVVRVREWLAQGLITVDAEGKAHAAQGAQLEAEEIHEEVMGVVSKKAAESALANAEEDYAIGNEIRQYWTYKAQEKGMALREYVRAALIFHDEYGDKLEELEKQQALTKAIIFAFKRDHVRIAKMDLFYRFIRYCLYLRSQGVSIPQRVIDDFYGDLTAFEAEQIEGLKEEYQEVVQYVRAGMANSSVQEEGEGPC